MALMRKLLCRLRLVLLLLLEFVPVSTCVASVAIIVSQYQLVSKFTAEEGFTTEGFKRACIDTKVYAEPFSTICVCLSMGSSKNLSDLWCVKLYWRVEQKQLLSTYCLCNTIFHNT